MTATTPSVLSWRTALVVVLTAAIVWLFVRSLDIGLVWRHIKAARPEMVAGALGATVTTYIFRAWRWQRLLRPLGRTRFVTSLRLTVIGFASSFLLPGRPGEILRPYLMARREGFAVAPAVATVVVERVLDFVVVLLLFGGFLMTTSIDVRAHAELWAQLKLWGTLAAVGAAIALVAIVSAAHNPGTLVAWSDTVGRRLPAWAAGPISSFSRTFGDGLGSMRTVPSFLAAMGLTILLWLSIALGIWFASGALDLTVSFPGTFLIMMFLVVGVAVPTPAGVGSFHWMYRLAVTAFFGAPDDTAAAAAIVLHAISVVPVAMIGLLLMAQEGLSLGRLNRMGSEGGLQ